MLDVSNQNIYIGDNWKTFLKQVYTVFQIYFVLLFT